MADDIPILDLSGLGEPPGMPALNITRGRFYAEAASVCLEDRGHAQDVEINVKGLAERKYRLRWPPATDQVQRSYNDLQDSTCFGAYGIALALARELTGMLAIRQTRKGPGFDYWIGETMENLETASRLEISGILNGDATTIKQRVNRKKRQTERSDETGLPAYVCVVEFSRPESHFEKR